MQQTAEVEAKGLLARMAERAPVPGGIVLTPGQQDALERLAAFANRVQSERTLAVLVGFAGTGKTTLVTSLIRELKSVGDDLDYPMRILVAAPTHKALQVLAKKLEEARVGVDQTATVHSALGLALEEHDTGDVSSAALGRSKLHEFDLAIIDEASMIGPEIYKHILATKGSCKVLFVGDPAQLPPVDKEDEGRLSPVFEAIETQVRLTEVVRQAADNPIIAMSMRIRGATERGDRVQLSEALGDLPQNKRAKAGLMGGGARAIMDVAAAELKAGTDCRVIAYRNKTVVGYNRGIHERLYGMTPVPFVEGEPAIVHEQAKSKTVDGDLPRTLHTNEELKVVSCVEGKHHKHETIAAWKLTMLRVTGETVYVLIPKDDAAFQAVVSAAFEEGRNLKKAGKMADGKKAVARGWDLKRSFATIRHAYALTSHKSQGSTFHTVLVDWADINVIPDVFTFGRAMYVAVTRASEHLAIVN